MGSFGEVTEFGHGFRSQFMFDSKYTNLNHGESALTGSSSTSSLKCRCQAVGERNGQSINVDKLVEDESEGKIMALSRKQQTNRRVLQDPLAPTLCQSAMRGVGIRNSPKQPRTSSCDTSISICWISRENESQHC